MSDDEKKAIKMAALYEFEDAKDALALIRAKAAQWQHLHEKVLHLLVRGRRDSAHLESAAKDAKAAVLAQLPAIKEVMDINAVLALDAELEAAVSRLKKAEQSKKELGFT